MIFLFNIIVTNTVYDIRNAYIINKYIFLILNSIKARTKTNHRNVAYLCFAEERRVNRRILYCRD